VETVFLVLLDHRVLKVYRVMMVSRDLKEIKVYQGMMERWVHRVLLE
jgi:hypothetical protein